MKKWPFSHLIEVIGSLGIICFMALKKKTRREIDDWQIEIIDEKNEISKKVRIDSESSEVSLPVTCERSNIQAFRQSVQASIRSGIRV